MDPRLIASTLPADRCRLDVWFWRAVEQLGLVPDAVLQQARVPIALPVASHCFLTTAQLFAVFDALEHLSGDPGVGIRFFEATMRVGCPPWTIAAIYAPTFRVGLAHIIRFKRYVMPEVMYVEENEDEISIFKHWFHAPDEAATLVDSSFAFLLAIAREGTRKRLRPVRIELARPGPTTDLHRTHFGCPIIHDAPRNAMVMQTTDCDMPFPGQNAQLLEILTPALASVFQDRQHQVGFAEAVKSVLKRSLTHGRSSLARTAREMGMSERTLQRRITAEGTTFSAIVKASRQELGRQLLSDPSMGISEVAGRLGYQDTTSFYRAFRSWEGVTPNQWQAGDRSEGQFAAAPGKGRVTTA